MTTKPQDSILTPWIAALSLGVTLGGWTLLARQEVADAKSTPQPATPTPVPVIKPMVANFPPIPTVGALTAYAAASTDVLPTLDLQPVPVVVMPAPRPQVVQAPAAQAPAAQEPTPQDPQTPDVQAPQAPPQAPPPVATTETSKK